MKFLEAHEIAAEYGVRLVNSAISSEEPRYTPCPVGKDTVIVSPDGRISSCYLLPDKWKEKGLDMQIGCLEGNGAVEIDKKKVEELRNLHKQNKRCGRCFCKWTRAGSCYVDVVYPGASPDYDEFCIQTRLLTLMDLLRRLGREDLALLLAKDRNQMEKITNLSSDLMFSC